MRITNAKRVIAEPEQATDKPAPSKLRTASTSYPIVKKSLEISKEVKQTKRLELYEEYMPAIVVLFILIALIVMVYYIVVKNVSNPIIDFAIVLSLFCLLYSVFDFIRNLLSHTHEVNR